MMSKAVFHGQYTGFWRIHICFYLYNLAVDFSFNWTKRDLFFSKGQKRLFFKMSQNAFAQFVYIAAVQSLSFYLILALVRLLQTSELLT